MYALVINNIVMDIEYRENPYKYYHPEIAKQFIPCEDTVKIGDVYENNMFVSEEDVNV